MESATCSWKLERKLTWMNAILVHIADFAKSLQRLPEYLHTWNMCAAPAREEVTERCNVCVTQYNQHETGRMICFHWCLLISIDEQMIGAKTFTRIPETEQKLRLQENKYASCNRLLDAMATREEPLQ
jgi:hypothetical protein